MQIEFVKCHERMLKSKKKVDGKYFHKKKRQHMMRTYYCRILPCGTSQMVSILFYFFKHVSICTCVTIHLYCKYMYVSVNVYHIETLNEGKEPSQDVLSAIHRSSSEFMHQLTIRYVFNS